VAVTISSSCMSHARVRETLLCATHFLDGLRSIGDPGDNRSPGRTTQVNRGRLAAATLALALCGTTATAQEPATSGGSTTAQSAAPQAAQPSLLPAQQADKNSAELSTEDTSTTFKVKVNLVEVRVVVRDAQGHAVGNLKQEDFQLLDNGKPQIISRFTVEKAGPKPPAIQQEGAPANGATLTLPTRYTAYLFDDIHLQFPELARARDAAERHLQSMQTTDRAAIFTTSGQTQLDFTDDRAKLRDTLGRIRPRSITGTGVTECPDMSYYMADQIQNKHDDEALRVAAQDADDCAFNSDATMMRQAAQMAQQAAMQHLNLGDHETQLSLAAVKDVVRRIAAMPGQRSIVIVSPGFYNPDQLQEQTEVADRALHSYVTISALDARGLYNVMLDASSSRSPSSTIVSQTLQIRRAEAMADADVLSELAYATGGTFFHNNNDLDKGFQQLDAPPEYSYLLAFSPQNLKFDGAFHNLKVKVTGPQKLSVQARKGYYAPKKAVGEAEQAKQQIQDEVFSQEELHDLPVELHTQFFKTSDDDAKLSVLARLDVRHLHYRKAGGRNNNSLTVVSALFDRNGNFVAGTQKVLQMRWKDETLDSKLASGITLKSSFDVKPGSYLVRLVVRDDEGQLAAQNGAIEIP
jgi:VWFA-related protein